MFGEKDAKIVSSILGDDFIEELAKSEIGGGLIKLNTQTALDPEEIRIALQVVPRTVLSYLFAHLKYRPVNDIIDLDLPFAINAKLHLNKKGPDNYSGEIIKDGKKCYEIKHRSIPGIGLILLTTFELYDLSLLDEIKQTLPKEEDDKAEKLQDMIDSRLTMHRLVQDVVDKRLSEREAIDRLIKEKLHSHIMQVNTPQEEEEPMEQTKKSKLREFLESREKKRDESFEMDKSEISCPDCGTSLHKNQEKSIKLCICYGDHMNKEIKIQKQEDGKVKLKFPKSFDIDNIEMLLEAVKRK